MVEKTVSTWRLGKNIYPYTLKTFLHGLDEMSFAFHHFGKSSFLPGPRLNLLVARIATKQNAAKEAYDKSSRHWSVFGRVGCVGES